MAWGQWVVGAVVGVAVAVRGYRKRSLSGSGAVAAALVGGLTLGAGAVWGVILLAFYFSGSAFTRFKAERKAALDLEYRGGGGERDASQVAATAGLGGALVAAYCTLTSWADPPTPRVMVPWGASSDGGGLGSALLLGYLAAFAMVCGDTWASELGILATGQPVLITSCRRVPPGTNGAVSAWGTAMSIAGGAFIGAVAAVTLAASALVSGAPGSAANASLSAAAWCIAVGAVAGGGGSALDSVLGALVQRTWVHRPSGKITSRLSPEAMAAAAPHGGDGGSSVATLDTTPESAAAARRRRAAEPPALSPPPPPSPAAFDVVCGSDLLSNEGVNFVTSALTAAAVVLATR